MGSARRTDRAPYEYGVPTQRQEVSRESLYGDLSTREFRRRAGLAPQYHENLDDRRNGVVPAFQKFFCPQCGHAIGLFNVEVGDNGYHMEAVCPNCRHEVQGVVQMPGEKDGDSPLPLTLVES